MMFFEHHYRPGQVGYASICLQIRTELAHLKRWQTDPTKGEEFFSFFFCLCISILFSHSVSHSVQIIPERKLYGLTDTDVRRTNVMHLPVKQGGFILPHDESHTNTHAGMQVWPNASEFESTCQTGKLEGWKEGRKGKGMHRYECACLQLQSVTHHQVAAVVRRFLFHHGKIPRIIHSEAVAAYLIHSASPSQSLTGNPFACVAGESEEEKNKRGKREKKNKQKENTAFGQILKNTQRLVPDSGAQHIVEITHLQTWGRWLSVWGWLIEYLEL